VGQRFGWHPFFRGGHGYEVMEIARDLKSGVRPQRR
jgi:hypothetical protein